MTANHATTKLDDRGRQSLRLEPEVWNAIDMARLRRAGSISRNTWNTEAIAEKLAREQDADVPLRKAGGRHRTRHEKESPYATGPGWPAGALEDPPRSALALPQSFRRLGQPARAAPQLSRRRPRGGDHAAGHGSRPAPRTSYGSSTPSMTTRRPSTSCASGMPAKSRHHSTYRRRRSRPARCSPGMILR